MHNTTTIKYRRTFCVGRLEFMATNYPYFQLSNRKKKKKKGDGKKITAVIAFFVGSR